MSITDELREWLARKFPAIDKEWHEEFTAIADRIDDEALSRRNEAYNMGYNAGIDMGFASADDWLAQHEDAMAEHGWVKLPVSEDGVPFRIGDKVDSDHYEDGTVTGIQFYEMANGGIRTLLAVRPDGWDVATWHTPDEYRHHHEPTVEDVLKDFIDAWAEWKDGAAMMNPVETYAAKLRLAGDAE